MNLEKSNVKYKAAADKKRGEKFFEERDMVMVYLRREKNSARAYNILKPKKHGSFKIVKKISDKTDVVDFSSDMEMSKTFSNADLYEYHPTEQLYPDYNSRRVLLRREGLM